MPASPRGSEASGRRCRPVSTRSPDQSILNLIASRTARPPGGGRAVWGGGMGWVEESFSVLYRGAEWALAHNPSPDRGACLRLRVRGGVHQPAVLVLRVHRLHFHPVTSSSNQLHRSSVPSASLRFVD